MTAALRLAGAHPFQKLPRRFPMWIIASRDVHGGLRVKTLNDGQISANIWSMVAAGLLSDAIRATGFAWPAFALPQRLLQCTANPFALGNKAALRSLADLCIEFRRNEHVETMLM